MSTRRLVTLGLLACSLAAARAGAQAAAATKPMAAGDAAIVAREQSLYDAVTRKDIPAFNRALGNDFVYVDQTGAMRWARSKSAEMFKDCTMGQWTLADPKVTRAGRDVMVITYTASGEQTCGGHQAPSPVYAMTVWQNRGGRWVAVAHTETPVAPKS